MMILMLLYDKISYKIQISGAGHSHARVLPFGLLCTQVCKKVAGARAPTVWKSLPVDVRAELSGLILISV